MEKENMNQGPDLERIGLFKEMGYIHEYVPVKISFNDSSKKGKQMMTNCTKSKAGTQDGYFAKEYPRVFEGEAYTDPIRARRRSRIEQAQKCLPPGFKYSSPPKKPCGLGSNYGTFTDYGKKIEYFSSKGRTAVKGSPSKKNILTNPAKKGSGYGYPNITIGKQPPYFLEEEYEELKNAPREPKKPEPRPFAPYRAGKFQQGYFDPNPYTSTKDIPPPVVEEEETEETATTPFIPSSPAKKDGGMKAGCLNQFPEYTGEPLPRPDLVPRGVKRYINAENQMFRPVPGPKPYPVKSIINKNVQKKVNPLNFKAIKGVVYCKK
ncbi:UPF0602 protein C4orf47 homolog [Stegodyphus dumicola]|uniref:UPF0602 protein C4orf47 homolog n=1 Tax=Stegodyphus dumicola TaxID=202533 RepID=UPI0015AEACA9|nr:UPF0602 protein C4orf47 homolog [Stegodyphus dumicola]